MFELKQQAKLASVTPIAEKHGEDNKLAASLKIEAVCNNAVLDEFGKGLRQAFYRKPGKSGEQHDLTNELSERKFPLLGELDWGDEYAGYELEVAYGLGLNDPLVFVDVTLKKFKFELMEGGSVNVTFNAVCHPNADECGALCALMQHEVDLTLRPPSKQELAEAA